MKQYLENRIKELNEKYEMYLEKYKAETSESRSKHYYIVLEKTEAAINELEKVLAMVE